MQLSVNWLKDFVFLPDVLNEEELALQLTLHSVQVEGIKKLGQGLDNIVVGEIKKVEKHKNADKLKLCHVSVGKEQVQIVCGGSNVAEGMKVIVAKIGAKVKWHGEGELVEMKKTEIRGVVSEGMICASDEVGLLEAFPKKDEREIVDLSSLDAKAGTPLAQALGLDDTIIDIENKSMTHRPDLWSHYGMAREIAAVQRKKIKEYKAPEFKAGKKQKVQVKVEEKELCPRYSAVMLDGIVVGPSPLSIQNRLRAVGINPINNIVDISNFVMMELGQPMHAFDAAKIKDATIVVRKAHEGEGFKSLNDVEYKLTPDTLVIADKEKPVAIAGVKGDKESGVTDATTSIIFEAANFDPISVRKSAQRFSLRTDSSSRFEKTLDPNMCLVALRRAVELTKQVCPSATVVSNIVDEGKQKLAQGPIVISFAFLNQKIGVEIEKKKVVDILERLGFEVKVKKDALSIKVPTWRATKDVRIKEDIVEEVARMYGFSTIPTSLPAFSIAPPPENPLRDMMENMTEIAAYECGFNETINYSFVSPELLRSLDISVANHIELDNPVAKDRPYLRRHILPSLLEKLEQNAHRYDSVSLFEIGRVFRKDESGDRVSAKNSELLPKQDTYFGAVYAAKGDETPFFCMSRLVRTMFDRLHIPYTIEKADASENTFVHPGRFAFVKTNGVAVARIGELHPRLQAKLDIASRVGIVECNINELVEVAKQQAHYTQLPAFPSIERDIAFVVASNIAHTEIEHTIKHIDPLVESVTLFDVFTGKSVKQGMKSVAYRIMYRAHDRTLETNEVEAIQKRVCDALIRTFKADIRS